MLENDYFYLKHLDDITKNQLSFAEDITNRQRKMLAEIDSILGADAVKQLRLARAYYHDRLARKAAYDKKRYEDKKNKKSNG